MQWLSKVPIIILALITINVMSLLDHITNSIRRVTERFLPMAVYMFILVCHPRETLLDTIDRIATCATSKALGYFVLLVLIMIETTTTHPNDAIKSRKGMYEWIINASMVLLPIAKWIESLIQGINTSRRRTQTTHDTQLRPHRRQSSSNSMLRLYAMAVLAMASPNSLPRTEGAPYDSDSRLVGVDNRCSGCITHQRADIPGTLKECNRVIKGFGGTRQFSIWTCFYNPVALALSME